MLALPLQVFEVIAKHRLALTLSALSSAGLVLLRRELQACARDRQRLRRLHDELTSSLRLELPLAGSRHRRTFAMQVCRAACSTGTFRRFALLLPNPEGTLVTVGRVGVDDLALRALEAAAERIPAQRPGRTPKEATSPYTPKLPAPADHIHPAPLLDGFVAQLERRKSIRPGDPAAMGCRDALILPLWSSTGQILGALAGLGELSAPDHQTLLRDASATLRVFGLRIASAIELSHLNERLLRAERPQNRPQPTAVAALRQPARDITTLPLPASRSDLPGETTGIHARRTS